MKKKFILFFVLVLVLFVPGVMAHCPLCTIGAGAAAGAAVWLGVSKIVVALLIGGFAMSMGMWFGRWADSKKKVIPFQKPLIIIVVFLTTVLPLLPIFSAIGPLYIPFIGEYGTTFAVNYALGSSLLGGIVVFVAPNVSKNVTKLRGGRMVPFQGILLTLSLLAIIGLIIQLAVV